MLSYLKIYRRIPLSPGLRKPPLPPKPFDIAKFTCNLSSLRYLKATYIIVKYVFLLSYSASHVVVSLVKNYPNYLIINLDKVSSLFYFFICVMG